MSGEGGVLRDIYPMLLQYHHLLPDEVGRQNPWVLMRLLDSLGDDMEEEINDDYLKIFYGKEV